MATSKNVGNLSLAVKRVGISSPAVEEQKFKGEDMPLPFILGGLVLAAAGYGFKKALMQAKPLIKSMK
ncbi:hypothetical protein BTM469_07490 [Helicobacter pylori]